MTPVLLYLLIAFGFTFAFHGLTIWLGLSFSSPRGQALYLIGMAGPLLGAVVVSALYGGSGAVRELLIGGLKWRFGVQWYLAAAFMMVGFYLGGIGLYRLMGGEVTGPLLRVSALGILGIMANQIWTQVAEEYGWRGLLQPLLDQRMGSLPAALLVGLIWAAWHLPMFWVPGSNQAGAFWQFTVWLLCWSVIMAALYHQTGGSTLSAMLFHMSLNVCFFAIRVPAGAVPYMLGLEILGALAAIPFLRRPLF